PLTDIHGDGWPPDWAVCGISWFDAAAFAQGAGARLLTEDEFEKAARGVDARRYPWGTTFDPALCKMALTRPGTPVPEPVGCVPADRSPFEVGDLAGVMRTFCARPNPNEDSVAHVRGGYWGAGERLCRSANRYPSQMRAVQAHLGVRLARNGTITN
ncbi:MAG: SUMF1/EgtB/PvdO family nonheme iron enzyme, partial [Myxococcota bacterium]